MRSQCFLVVLSCVLCALATAQSTGTNTGVIAGVVEDSGGARIPKARVQLRDQSDRLWNAATNEAGEFRAEVPAGLYTLGVAGPRGFMPFNRPKFLVNSGDKLTFRIQLEVASTCNPVDIGIVGEGITQYEEPEPTCFPAQRTLAVDEKSNRELVVSYWERTGTGVTREYIGAALYCDIYAVMSDKILYDSGKKRAAANGKVVVEDGHSTRRVQSAVIQWPECRPEIVE